MLHQSSVMNDSEKIRAPSWDWTRNLQIDDWLVILFLFFILEEKPVGKVKWLIQSLSGFFFLKRTKNILEGKVTVDIHELD